MTLTDFPKLHSPFVRKIFKTSEEDWKIYGKKLKMRKPEVYLVVNEINPGYEWVLYDPYTIAVEKLDGTNVKLFTEAGKLKIVQNRKNVIDVLQINKKEAARSGIFIEGILQAATRGYINLDGEQCGELIGPQIQGNPYNIDTHFWYPFDKAIKHLSYRSFHEHARTFNNWSSWFKDYLVSRFASKHGKKEILAEGVVFYNLKRKTEGKTYMAKLRRDMFWWYYKQVEIYGYV